MNADVRLSQHTESLLDSFDHQPMMSIASLWEMSIKMSVGKLKLPMPFPPLVEKEVIGRGFGLLPIMPEHLDVLATLLLHHRDPFDRLIIAQALAEDIPVLTSDGAFGAYGIELLNR